MPISVRVAMAAPPSPRPLPPSARSRAAVILKGLTIVNMCDQPLPWSAERNITYLSALNMALFNRTRIHASHWCGTEREASAAPWGCWSGTALGAALARDRELERALGVHAWVPGEGGHTAPATAALNLATGWWCGRRVRRYEEVVFYARQADIGVYG